MKEAGKENLFLIRHSLFNIIYIFCWMYCCGNNVFE